MLVNTPGLGKGALSEWKTGWHYLLCANMGAISIVVGSYTTGLMIKPLGEAHGWSRAEVSGGLLAYSIATLLSAPLAGALIDRFGPRRVSLMGAPLAGAAFASIGLTGPTILSWYLAWAAFGFVALLMGPQLWASVISRHFDASRGLALSVGAMGNGLGALVWPPLTVLLIDQYGWRVAYVTLGVTIATSLTFCCYVFMRGPVALSQASTLEAQSAISKTGLTFREAVSTTLFWRIAFGVMLIGGSTAAVTIHLPALLSDKGMSPMNVVQVMTILAPAVIVGRLGGGVLLDRVSGRFVMLLLFFAPALACLILVDYNGGYLRAALAAMLIGLATGADGDLNPFLISRYFGLRSFAAIYGALLSVFVIGFGGAPTLAGALFDNLGSYDEGLIVTTILLVIYAPVIFTLPRYRYGTQSDGEQPGATK